MTLARRARSWTCPVEAITARPVGCTRPARRRPPAGAVRGASRRAAIRIAALLVLLGSPNLCSREYLYRHYDSEVQGRTWLRPGEADAAVIRVHPERADGRRARGRAATRTGAASDPELGARHAVAEAARNVACVGARPWALTDCLNFGASGETRGDGRPGRRRSRAWRWRPKRSAGLPRRGAPLPFVSGNVSLYNQTGDATRFRPSPIVMCAGVCASDHRDVWAWHARAAISWCWWASRATS